MVQAHDEAQTHLAHDLVSGRQARFVLLEHLDIVVCESHDVNIQAVASRINST
jgi:hypothetical protein